MLESWPLFRIVPVDKCKKVPNDCKMYKQWHSRKYLETLINVYRQTQSYHLKSNNGHCLLITVRAVWSVYCNYNISRFRMLINNNKFSFVVNIGRRLSPCFNLLIRMRVTHKHKHMHKDAVDTFYCSNDPCYLLNELMYVYNM